MTTSRLKPSLASIEARLCGPSDGLLRRWLVGDSTLPKDLAAHLESDPEAVWRRQELELADQDEGASEPGPARPARPDLLWRFSQAVRRREALSRASFPSNPIPGQIRWVERLCAPDGSTIMWDFPQPLIVVLGAPAATGSSVWYGWTVAPDTDYAAYWDMVLGPQDEPRDPRAEVVQAWNTLLVDIRGAARVAGQLSSERLAALQALSDDFLEGPAVGTEHSAPGELIERAIAGHRVVTGTPYGAPQADPRLEYQSLYHAAAAPLRLYAREALGQVGQTVEQEVPAEGKDVAHWIREAIADVIDRFRECAESAALAFQEVALVPTPASTEPAGPTRSVEFANLLHISVYARPTRYSAVLHARLARLGPEPIAIEVLQDGIVTVSDTLTDARPVLDFPISGEGEVVLRIVAPISVDLLLSGVAG